MFEHPAFVAQTRAIGTSFSLLSVPCGTVLLKEFGACTHRIGISSHRIWAQYKKNIDTFYDGDTEVAKKDEGPAIDGQLPYRFQEQPGDGEARMSDQPGLRNQAGDTDAEYASKQLKKIGVAQASGKKITKLVRVEKFWSYLICTDPYKVFGHYEWGFTVTLDTGDKTQNQSRFRIGRPAGGPPFVSFWYFVFFCR
jgi:hypothetical protein